MYNHRYFCLMCLAIYGAKCGVPYEQVEKDVLEFVPFMNAINPDDPFTVSDAESALECYDHRYCTFPIKDIEVISAIAIKRNRRNGQKQAEHLEEARAIRDLRMRRQGRKWTDGNGRPDKSEIIIEYIADHPDASVSEIAKALGVSRTTVYKYKDKKVIKMQEKQGSDHVDKLSDGKEVLIEAEPGLSEYDQMRLARLKKYQKLIESQKNDYTDDEKDIKMD